jgi:hypothetical protein
VHCLAKSIDPPDFAAHNCIITFSTKAIDSNARVWLDITNSSSLQPLISTCLKSEFHMQPIHQYLARIALRYLLPACFDLCYLDFLILLRLAPLHHHLRRDCGFSKNSSCLIKRHFRNFDDDYLSLYSNFFHLSYCYFSSYHQGFFHFH